MSSILDAAAKMKNKTAGRPPAAVEITPEGVLAAALPASGGPLSYAFEALPEGFVSPGIEETNLRAPEAVSNAIRSALEQVSPRIRAVTLIVPDTLVRVFMLDFDSMPAKAAEAIPVLRFRLRKMVPFDVEQAGVSYQILSQKKDECKVLAAIIPGPVLAEYESAVRAAGYEPGAVLPSSLAAIETVDSMEAVLAANLSTRGITTLIANGQELLLYRHLDLPENAVERAREIARSIAVATAYYEDKLGASPTKLYYAGHRDATEFAEWLGETDLAVVELAGKPEAGVMTSLAQNSIAGVTGALAGARA
jgi:type IV pilus assembly protein PilM